MLKKFTKLLPKEFDPIELLANPNGSVRPVNKKVGQVSIKSNASPSNGEKGSAPSGQSKTTHPQRTKEGNPNFYSAPKRANAKNKNQIANRFAETIVNNRLKHSAFVTLTFEDRSLLPRGCFRKVQLWFKRAQKRSYYNCIVVGAPDVSQATGNLHFHFVVNADDPRDIERLLALWDFGAVKSKPIAPDTYMNSCYKIAQYMFKNFAEVRERFPFIRNGYLQRNIRVRNKAMEPMTEEESEYLYEVMCELKKRYPTIEKYSNYWHVGNQLQEVIHWRVPNETFDTFTEEDIRLYCKAHKIPLE